MRNAKAKPRTVNDPRVRRVLRAIDCVLASPHVEELLSGVLSSLFTFGCGLIDFLPRDGWTPASARATVLAYAMNVPEPLLEDLARIADKEIAWVTTWDRRGWLEVQIPGGSDMTLAQLKREYAARAS